MGLCQPISQILTVFCKFPKPEEAPVRPEKDPAGVGSGQGTLPEALRAPRQVWGPEPRTLQRGQDTGTALHWNLCPADELRIQQLSQRDRISSELMELR